MTRAGTYFAGASRVVGGQGGELRVQTRKAIGKPPNVERIGNVTTIQLR
jgi:hypothetical protein